MTYELASELESAGFPFKDKWYSGMWKGAYPLNPDGTHKVVRIYPVLLGELIEACGIHLAVIEKLTREDASTYWMAHGNNHSFVSEATTPEEAVARLWLALNAKV